MAGNQRNGQWHWPKSSSSFRQTSQQEFLDSRIELFPGQHLPWATNSMGWQFHCSLTAFMEHLITFLHPWSYFKVCLIICVSCFSWGFQFPNGPEARDVNGGHNILLPERWHRAEGRRRGGHRREKEDGRRWGKKVILRFRLIEQPSRRRWMILLGN